MDGTPGVVAWTSYDGLGRPILSQQGQTGASSLVSVATVYDQMGRTRWTSTPYNAAVGSYQNSGSGTTTSYDASGRPLQTTDAGGGYVRRTYNLNDVLVATGPAPSGENLKQRSLEYNGAGALVSVCEVTSALPNTGACGQSTAHTGYLTLYSHTPVNGGSVDQVVQNAQPSSSGSQTRTVYYDASGRKVQEQIPETGASYYAYDNDPGGQCPGTYTGDLVKSVDNMGNVTCYGYDGLHRMLSAQVVSGPYQFDTPSKYMVYDQASLNGTAMSNALGSLAEAYTCWGNCGGGRLTDLYLSASPEISGGQTTGRTVSQIWESTPNSNGFFSTQSVTRPNGAPLSVTAALGGTSLGVTYGVDGDGRILTATAGVGGNMTPLVLTTGYTPLGSPSFIFYGEGDLDTFTYDPATNRPTSFQYAMWNDAQTIQGNLAWNQDGSLGNFTYTDGTDSSMSQNCSYGMDDLNRLAMVNCAGSWGQSFHYDAFGNIQKLGLGSGTTMTSTYMAGVAPTLGYSALSNHVVQGAVAAYDGNGNQTATQSSNLSWNASAQPHIVDGVSATYDALGRLVENDSGGGATEYVYTPGGAKMAVVQNGQLIKGTVPLPGGGTAIFNGGGFAYFRHKDWLGSSRMAKAWDYGHIVSKTAYAPFGETYNEAGAQDRSFTGEDQDTTNGVYDYLFRRYDPVAGRWLSPDPAGWSSVSPAYPQSLNRYAYVQNNPMKLVDPSGLDCIYFNDGGGVSNINPGDCVSPNDNGYYVDAKGVTDAYLDGNGNLSEYYTAEGRFDPNGNILPWDAETDTPDPNVLPDMSWPSPGNAPGQPGTQGIGAPNNGMIRPVTRAFCASSIADNRYSIAAHTSGSSPDNPFVKAFLGNGASGVYNILNNDSLIEAFRDVVSGGANQGIPGGNWINKGVVGVVTDLLVNGFGANASKAGVDAVGGSVGWGKLAYDVGSFAYAYVLACRN